LLYNVLLKLTVEWCIVVTAILALLDVISCLVLINFMLERKRLYKATAFLPARRYASAGNRHSNVSVRPSVRLTRAGIVSKRRKLAA